MMQDIVSYVPALWLTIWLDSNMVFLLSTPISPGAGIAGATGAGAIPTATSSASPPQPKSDVVLRERANIQGAYIQVIMHQLVSERAILWL